MLSNKYFSSNYQAESIIDNVSVAQFNATSANNGPISFAMNINDQSVYKANQQTVDKDFYDFREEVINH